MKKAAIKQTTITMIMSIASFLLLLLSITLFFIIWGATNQVDEFNESRYSQTYNANRFMDGSAYLTNEVRAYAATGYQIHYDNYWNEINQLKNRDIGVANIREIGVTPEEDALIELMSSLSNNLVPLEEAAMALTMEGKTAEAVEAVYGKEYEEWIGRIREAQTQFLTMLDDRFAREIGELYIKTDQYTVYLMICLILAALFQLASTAVARSTGKKSHWYETVLDSFPFPISVTDLDMKWTFINKPVEQMLNVKRADMLGKPCSSWGAAICNTENCGVTCLRNGKSTTFFEQAGSSFKVDTDYLYDQRGRKIGHVEAVQDVTEMQRLQKAQSELVEKIREVSGAFVSGSKNIADGAGNLAQGSTEQAATVQQLSASIVEISGKAKDNANNADKTATLMDEIKNSAETGSQRMERMTGAVRDINAASQSIGKVIKVIDDIAFQTNILALNASVEAARAGQHGKGFAVVADEVRSLAAKSAEAAQDTSSLISDSMEKAELGARIADETASSLNDIVSGISESSQLVKQIAKASGEQSAALTEIESGIDQIAKVIQTNSATAEESAAASEEMSGQADFLQELVSSR